ncbi:hypothetical protein HRbin17_01092 [bacterium HR17]|uniref:Uncharacterized protein n=1 Tax=Candidatus Fervidibacter japonicus TaxID=2035412 RepID=A0A2H5XBM4_9BACT|nr:hypothetical protein HRbin17_01092 [bacterium HR17]
MHRSFFGGSREPPSESLSFGGCISRCTALSSAAQESRPPRVCRSEGASPDAPLFLRRLKRAALREFVVRRVHLPMHRSFFGGSGEPPSESLSFGGCIS